MNIWKIVVILLIPMNLHAQDEAFNSEYSFIEKRFFHFHGFEILGGVTPAYTVIDNSRSPTGVQFQSTTLVLPIVGHSYEPRINLLDFKDKSSISISLPTNATLGVTMSIPDDEANSGFFSLSSGLFASYNVGYHSTYNNISNLGFSLSAGIRFHRSPLIRIPVKEYKTAQFSRGPSLRFVFKHDLKNDLNKVYIIESGIPSFKVLGKLDQEESRITNAYVMVGIGQILNY